MHQFLTGRISDRLKSALSSTDDAEPVVSEAVAEPEPTDNDVVTTDNDVVTTEEEWRAYYVVTALTPDVPADRVTLRASTLLALLYEPAPICRLHFTAQKRLGLVDANKSEERVPERERHLRPRRARQDGATVSGEVHAAP